MAGTRATHPLRTLLLLASCFTAGIVCFWFLRFNAPLLNYLFVALVLTLPFIAIRPLLQFSRFPKIIGFVFLAPLLAAELLVAFGWFFVSTFFWGIPWLELHHYRENSCIQEISRVDQKNYSVHLLRDCGGGAPVSFTVWIEQRMPVLPGLYVVREIDSFDGAYRGKLSSVDKDEVRLQIPIGPEGSGWNQEIDRTYQLKRHVYLN